ncbi:MAG: ATP12 family protein [Hyphomicrobiaceae bacterium]|nr:ATP12 family protein [Hyphomicrobiaceae bacterium]
MSADEADDGEGRGSGGPAPVRMPGREALDRPLPKRFYRSVSVGPSATSRGHAVLLDGRTARTPGRRPLVVPDARLAETIAGEWAAVDTTIDPARMPLTRLVNTAIDGVAGRMDEVAADIVKYAASDLLCYRADFPEGLVARQHELWDPVLAWAAQHHGIVLRVATGLMPVAQPADAAQAFARAIASLDPFRLTALHVMTTLMGSALLAIAVLDGQLTPEAAWEAAHVDEDWQIDEWGEDAEATARRARRFEEMRAAAGLTRLTAAEQG